MNRKNPATASGDDSGRHPALSSPDGTPGTSGTRLLSGIRVLDLTRLLPGAYCTQMLADFGAEIIKIEQPGSGDYWRWSPPTVKTQGTQFLALNRGKRSVTINLKSPEGNEAFLKLCETADIVLEGFRPGVMARLGLASDVLQARNPSLIICSLTGFGQDGPLANVAAHDLNYLGMAGLLELTVGRTDAPSPTGIPLGDIGGGALMALVGMLAALNHRTVTGQGHVIDVSVLDGLLSWSGFLASRWNAPGQECVTVPFDAPFDKPFYTVYETSDGRHMITGSYEEKFWATLCKVMERPEWEDRQWATGAEEQEIRDAFAAEFRKKTQSEWIEIFTRQEACVTPVNSLREALESDHAKARGSVITVEDPVEGSLNFVGNPVRIDGAAQNADTAAPRLGADTDQLLTEIGYSDDQIARLRTEKAI